MRSNENGIDFCARCVASICARCGASIYEQFTASNSNHLCILFALLIGVINAVACSSARADLVVSPSTGSVIFSGIVGSDGTNDQAIRVTGWTGFSGNYFGASVASYGSGIYVSENGNINFAGDTNFFPLTSPNVARISPLWDDYLFLQDDIGSVSNRVLVHTEPGQYIGATWENVRLWNESVSGSPIPDTDRSFQTLWFENDTPLRGFDFKRNDIVFSYVGHQKGTSNFGDIFSFTGVQSGDGREVFLPGTQGGDGLLFASDGNKLAWQDNSFILLRAKGSGASSSYDISIQSFTAVPEPSSLAFAGIVTGLTALYRLRRKALRQSANERT